MIYSCEEHIDEAIEEAIDIAGLPPVLTFVSKELKVVEKCFFCNEVVMYKVSGNDE